MNDQDRQAIDGLFQRLAEVERRSPQRDAGADAVIREEIARQPGAPYYMAQTIVMQDYALQQAQAHIAELERQAAEQARALEEARRQPAQNSGAGGGFLSGLFGSSQTPDSAGASRGSVPSVPRSTASSVWGNATAAAAAPMGAPMGAPTGAPQGYGQQPGYGQQQPGFGGGPAPGAAPGRFGGGGGFLAGAAQTAMGVAGGVLLGNAIAGMFGSGAAHAAAAPEVVNEIIEPGNSDAGKEDAGNDQAGSAADGDTGADQASYDDASGGDDGGGFFDDFFGSGSEEL